MDISMDISMDIHIHGNPGDLAVKKKIKTSAVTGGNYRSGRPKSQVH